MNDRVASPVSISFTLYYVEEYEIMFNAEAMGYKSISLSYIISFIRLALYFHPCASV